MGYDRNYSSKGYDSRKKYRVTKNTKAQYDYKAKKLQAKTLQKNRDRPAGVIASIGEEAGALAGSGIPIIGPIIGRFLGGKLGHLVEQVTGFGDYKVNSNTVLSGGMPVPQIVNSINNGGVIVRHREYVTDIKSSTSFVAQKFVLNPGLKDTFPWLSQVAAAFEQYRLRGVLFEFVSTSSDSILSTASSTALGTVIMATDYDVADAAPTEKRTMLNNEFSCSAKPSVNFIHPVECKRSITAQNILYTRNTIATPGGFDPRLYDFSNFYIATDGMQTNGGTVGELWVTYEVEFMKQEYKLTSITDHYQISTINATNLFGTNLAAVNAANISRGATLGGTLTALSYIFPLNVSEGTYVLEYHCQAGTSLAVGFPTFAYVNCQPVNLSLQNTVANYSSPNNAVVSNRFMFEMFIQVYRSGASIVFSTDGAYPTGAGSIGDVTITRIANSIA